MTNERMETDRPNVTDGFRHHADARVYLKGMTCVVTVPLWKHHSGRMVCFMWDGECVVEWDHELSAWVEK